MFVRQRARHGYSSISPTNVIEVIDETEAPLSLFVWKSFRKLCQSGDSSRSSSISNTNTSDCEHDYVCSACLKDREDGRYNDGAEKCRFSTQTINSFRVRQTRKQAHFLCKERQCSNFMSHMQDLSIYGLGSTTLDILILYGESNGGNSAETRATS
jgi:hypothetical protein